MSSHRVQDNTGRRLASHCTARCALSQLTHRASFQRTLTPRVSLMRKKKGRGFQMQYLDEQACLWILLICISFPLVKLLFKERCILVTFSLLKEGSFSAFTLFPKTKYFGFTPKPCLLTRFSRLLLFAECTDPWEIGALWSW